MAELVNPYWDAVAPHVVQEGGRLQGEGPIIQRWRDDFSFNRPEDFLIIDRRDYVKKYAWTVTDPASVDFVHQWAGDGLVDPMAGTGYWAYLLGQQGVDVVCYDKHTPDKNPWHGDHEPWVPVTQMDGAEAAAKHPDRTLLLAWPPYDEPDGADIVRAYAGERVIYLGEQYGATGDDNLRGRLQRDWKEVAEHRPVRWDGLYDSIIVYERS